jgi:hypothetical protein
MSTQRTARATTLGLALLLVTRLALGTVYSFVVPIFEAYDENGHFAYVRYLAKYHQLLDPSDPEARAVYERFQPPLYYLLVAPFLLGFDLGDHQPTIERNPLFVHGTGGLNYALHPPRLSGAEAEIALAVRAARLASVLISTLSVLFVYHMARRVWPGEHGPVWALTLLYAFWPQFLFNGSMITNDLAVTAFAAGVLALAVQLVVEGFRPGRALGLALCLAAAVLSKINALALLPVAVIAVALSLTPVLRQARWRSPGPWLVVGALVAVVAGAFAALNSLDFVTAQVLRLRTVELLLQNLTRDPNAWRVLVTAVLYGFRTFFASFGWGNVETWPWVYTAWAAAFGLGVLGLVVGAGARAARRQPGADGRVLLLMGLQLGGTLAVALALVVALNTKDLAPGRYLLPALPAVLGLLVEGWQALLRRLPAWVGRFAWRGVSLGVVVLGWAIPLATLVPTYAIPQPLAGPVEVPARYAFGEAIELIGHQTPQAVRPGATAELGVCWQAAAPVPEDYTVFLEAIGPDGQGYGRLVSYPGRGNFATRFWTPGVPFCDRYRLLVEDAMPAPAQAWVRVVLLKTTDVNGERLPVTDEHGQRVALDAYTVPLPISAAEKPPAPDQALDYRFGDALRLRGYSLALEPGSRQVRVRLHWEALRDLDEDYVVFVHLRDEAQSIYAQADSAPRAGWYPTSLWRRGEVVDDTHTLTLPEGAPPTLALYVGVVNPALDARLPAVDGASQPLLNDELRLLSDWALGSAWSLPASLAPP